MPKQKKTTQLIWGALLLMAGIGVFFRIPQVMPEIRKIEVFSSAIFFIQFCFYVMGILLIGGGIKKIFHNLRNSGTHPSSDIHDNQ